MKKIKLLLIITMGIILNSCFLEECIRVPLSKSSLDWYKYLPNEGDTLLYKGTDNSVDTFVITNKYIGYGQCNRFEFGEFQYQKFNFTSTNINSKTSNNFIRDFTISFAKKDSSANETYQYINLFDLYIEGINDVDETIEIDSENSEKNGLYVDVQSTKSKRYESTNPVSIESFYWSKKHGLQKYTTVDNVSYEFWKKI